MSGSSGARWKGFHRAMELLEIEPRLGGIITVGFRPDEAGWAAQGAGASGWQRVPPHGQLTAYRSPWGWHPGLLDQGARFIADLDILPPATQALLAGRLDLGDCVLLASCSEAPWAHLADRVAFLAAPPQQAGTPDHAPEPAKPGHPAFPPGRRIGIQRSIAAISATALRWGVEGHRAELFTLLAAGAIARSAGRRAIYEGDVAEAIALVLAPRASAHAARAEPEPASPPDTTGGALEQSDAPPLTVPVSPLPPAPVQVKPSLHGAPVRPVQGRRRRGTLDLHATLLAALPWQALRSRGEAAGLAIRPSDLRWYLRRHRQGRLIIFAVDGSGSMGPRRLGQAKGAVLGLLQQAYRRRDQVALIVAAGREARLLLPPVRAVERARRRLVRLPAGGATPLAGALLLARSLALRARRRDDRPTLLTLMTDGRANQPLPGGERANVREELKRSALSVRALGVQSVVLSEPAAEALELTRWLGGEFRLIGRSGSV